MAQASGPTPTADARFLEALGNNAAMINGHFNLPKDTVVAMGAVREAVSECMFKIYMATVATGTVKYDSGAMIHVSQLLQQAKNRACDALILPYGPGAAAFTSYQESLAPPLAGLSSPQSP